VWHVSDLYHYSLGRTAREPNQPSPLLTFQLRFEAGIRKDKSVSLSQSYLFLKSWLIYFNSMVLKKPAMSISLPLNLYFTVTGYLNPQYYVAVSWTLTL
jgi:hypothetical protein